LLGIKKKRCYSSVKTPGLLWLRKSNTLKHEMLNEIVDEIEAEFKQLAEYLFEMEEPPTLEEIEVSFRQSMHRIGGKFVECYVKSRNYGYMGRRIACSCGSMAESVGYRPKQIQTLIGQAKIERAYYHCKKCGSGFAPIDEELKLSRRSFSKTVERAVCRLAVVESFESTVDDLYDIGGISISAKEAQIVSESVGAELARVQSEEVREVFELDKEVKAEDDAVILLIEMDGKIVPTHDGGRELKVAAISELVVGESPDDSKIGKTTYVGNFEIAEEFGRYVWTEAARRGVEQANKVVGLGDGAAWIWNRMGEHFPDAVQILDFYHVSEHLWSLGNALYGQGKERTKKFVDYKLSQIWSGQVDKSINALMKLKFADQDKSEKLRIEIGYLQDNRRRMDYPSYKANGYHVGSGVVESACKQFGARLDQAGMRWKEPGAGSIAALRALKLSGRWDDYWKPARPPLYA
jgi:hypothetical protein